MIFLIMPLEQARLEAILEVMQPGQSVESIPVS